MPLSAANEKHYASQRAAVVQTALMLRNDHVNKFDSIDPDSDDGVQLPDC